MFVSYAKRNIWCLAAVALATVSLTSISAFAQGYVQTNLVSDIPGRAVTTDPLTVNPWGISRSSTSPWWISDNGTGVSTIYTGDGVAVQNPPGTQFVVNIPSTSGSGKGNPTGQVFNGSSDFSGAPFIFVAEDGGISAWIPSVDQFNAVLKVNHSATAIYKGVTIASFNNANYLYAADFHSGIIEVFDKNFDPVSFSSTAFTDSTLPTGYAPFNIQAIGNAIVVAFAQQDDNQEDEVAGAGLGFVDIFTTDGNLLMRLESGPWMNAPWGVAMAPSNFGDLSNRLLIGNFGSGLTAAFDPSTGAFVSLLKQSNGLPLRIYGLWALEFGNGASAGPANALFFTAGSVKERHGLFGKITAQ